MEEKKQPEDKEIEELNHPENDIFENLPAEDQLILKDLSPEKKIEVGKILLQKQIQVTQMSYSGPVPHPSLLQGYENVIEGGAERLLKMAEKQSDHRMSIEKTVVTSQMKQSERGQHYGLGISVTCLILATVMAFFGLTAVAIALLTSTIIGLTAVFVIGRKRQNPNKKEEEE